MNEAVRREDGVWELNGVPIVCGSIWRNRHTNRRMLLVFFGTSVRPVGHLIEEEEEGKGFTTDFVRSIVCPLHAWHSHCEFVEIPADADIKPEPPEEACYMFYGALVGCWYAISKLGEKFIYVSSRGEWERTSHEAPFTMELLRVVMEEEEKEEREKLSASLLTKEEVINMIKIQTD